MPERMNSTETNSPLDYGKPPWVFKGSALYQLHLVKAETARAFIPQEFKLVEAFGYTLGGFFLANYKDSPVGMFDELVVIAGLVWNPPTSCAWAARVLVNNEKACIHGRKDVGLPSQVANFKKRVTALPKTKEGWFGGFLSKVGVPDSLRVTALPKTKEGWFGGFLSKVGVPDSPSTTNYSMDVQVKEMNSHNVINVCSTSLGSPENENDSKKWLGPAIKLSLPSFSGRTEHVPHLLKYSCQIECRLRTVSPAKVSNIDGELKSEFEKRLASGDFKRNMSISVLLSKPILALEFNTLKMSVEAPSRLGLSRGH